MMPHSALFTTVLVLATSLAEHVGCTQRASNGLPPL
jgi:hypothetical protein